MSLRALALGLAGALGLAPILAGLAETARLAAQADAAALLAAPGLWRALTLTLWTGLGGTALALALAFGACATFHGGAGARRLARALGPVLAAPHAAMAVGLAFLIAPWGWIARLLAPLAGWSAPPLWPLPHDPWGLSLILGLAVKETPFLLLMSLAALGRLPAAQTLAAGAALGRRRATIWARILAPQLYALIRRPVWIALAFALTNVDMALILGPSAPPTLAVLATRWFLAPQAGMAAQAALLALGLAGLTALAILGWIGAERALAARNRRALWRGAEALPLHAIGGWAAAALLALGIAALAALALWSLSWRWPFPAALPESLSLRVWAAPARWGDAALTTLGLGAAAALAALALALMWLEGEDRAGGAVGKWAEALLLAPLIAPQIAFLFGLNTAFQRLGAQGVWAVIWAHTLFVFPYVMIALAGPWRALDRRLLAAGAALGAGPAGVFWRLKLPLLIRPLLTALAVGFAVSVALYLPTLFIGQGRVATLTTEAVALASGADRRVVGVMAALQAALPFIGFALALGAPALLHRRRAGMRGAR